MLYERTQETRRASSLRASPCLPALSGANVFTLPVPSQGEGSPANLSRLAGVSEARPAEPVLLALRLAEGSEVEGRNPECSRGN